VGADSLVSSDRSSRRYHCVPLDRRTRWRTTRVDLSGQYPDYAGTDPYLAIWDAFGSTWNPVMTTFSRDRWHCVELHVAVGSDGRLIELFLDGVSAARLPHSGTHFASGSTIWSSEPPRATTFRAHQRCTSMKWSSRLTESRAIDSPSKAFIEHSPRTVQGVRPDGLIAPGTFPRHDQST